MHPIAVIYSKSEAMVIASLLDARGIICHIGGYNHASVSFYQVALGGFRLTVPAYQHQEASKIIVETPGYGTDQFSYGLQRAVVRFLLIWTGLVFSMGMVNAMANPDNWITHLAVVPGLSIAVPVSPQGFGNYMLSIEKPD